jgi:peptidoglycan/xylan/chitin deacetylase (PgdA/CDA1 family)
MYHRVAAPAVDPWNLCVSPQNFAGHMQALSEMADVLPLQDLPANLRSGRRSRAVAAVTFDDAYLDNLTTAKPVLDALNIPATVFVPTGWIGDPRPMWWDRLAHLLLAAEVLPETLEIHAQGEDFSWRNRMPTSPARPGEPHGRACIGASGPRCASCRTTIRPARGGGYPGGHAWHGRDACCRRAADERRRAPGD